MLYCRTPIQFPEVCARCGVETGDTIAVKIRSGKPGLKPMVLLGHVGHLIEGVQELHSGSTKIPCCQRCRRYFLIGRRTSLAFLTCAPIIFFLVGKYANNWPEWLMVLSGFICFTMLFGSLIPYAVGQAKSAPVTIWRGGGGYYYHFHTGAYCAWAERQKVQNPQI